MSSHNPCFHICNHKQKLDTTVDRTVPYHTKITKPASPSATTPVTTTGASGSLSAGTRAMDVAGVASRGPASAVKTWEFHQMKTSCIHQVYQVFIAKNMHTCVLLFESGLCLINLKKMVGNQWETIR